MTTLMTIVRAKFHSNGSTTYGDIVSCGRTDGRPTDDPKTLCSPSAPLCEPLKWY